MPRCIDCDYKWGLKDIMQLGFSRKGKECPHCSQKQYISSETQRLFTIGYLSLLFLPLLIFRIKLTDKKESMF